MVVTCENCGSEFNTNDLNLVLAWEDYNNEFPYWTCPDCEYNNFVYDLDDN